MNILKSLLLVGLSLSIGCMSNDTVDDVDINEDSLYGHYRGTFNANTKEMKLFAQLRLGGDGGTTVRMVNGRLLVHGDPMMEVYGDEAFINLLGTYYRHLENVHEPEENYAITWLRGDGREVVNHIAMPGAVRILNARAIPVANGH